MEMPPQKQIDPLRKEKPNVRGVRRLVQWMGDEAEAKPDQGISRVVCRKMHHLVVGEQQMPRVVVIATHPGGVEAQDMDVKREARQTHCSPVAQASPRPRGSPETAAAPLLVSLLAFQHTLSLTISETERGLAAR